MQAIIITALAALLFFPGRAHAGYLDPGSGSILVQGIVATLAFFGRIAARIKRIFLSGQRFGR